jgi:hypothetical protein
VSPLLACIGSPCLRHCVHGVSIGSVDGGGSYDRLEVTRVTRIEDAKMWREYMQALEDIEPALGRSFVEPPQTVVMLNGDEQMLADWTIGSTLELSKNEALLWHGTTHGQDATDDIAAIIRRSGFDERVTSLQGLYGAAVYFAEASSKADACECSANIIDSQNVHVICSGQNGVGVGWGGGN